MPFKSNFAPQNQNTLECLITLWHTGYVQQSQIPHNNVTDEGTGENKIQYWEPVTASKTINRIMTLHMCHTIPQSRLT